LGTAAVKTGSVFFPMLMHAANNSLSVIYILLYGFADSTVYTTAVTVLDSLLLILGLVFMTYLKKTSYFAYFSDHTGGTDTINHTGYNPKLKDVICPYSIAYLVYVIYLMSRWVYVI